MKKQLLQHNSITEARYDMSALEKDIFYLVLAQIKDDDPPKMTYRVQVKDLMEGKGKDIDHVHFRRTAKKLLSQVLSVPVTEEKKFIEISLVSSSEYLKGLGVIEIELSTRIRSFLFGLKKNFTTLQLKEALNLRSKHAKRIYEMLCRYKDTGMFNISVYEMKCRLGLVDLNTGVEQYIEFALFKKYVLEQARRELSNKTNITFSYKATKTGRKYTHLHFVIKPNPHHATLLQVDPASQQNLAIFEKLTKRFKLSPWQAVKVLEQVPLAEIHKTTYDVQLEIVNHKVNNVGGYTAKVFNQKYDLGLFKE